MKKLVKITEEIGSISPFSIVPRMYESDLDNKYGIELRKLRNGQISGFKGNLKENVMFNEGEDYPPSKIEQSILKKYESLPGFCSMVIENRDQLEKHIKFIHELSYCHYIFGKESDMDGMFPNYCCGFSANNLLLNLMDRGYPNATRFSNYELDHAYNGLPFLFGDNQEKGFILVDPTSDQLFNNKKIAPRNNIFVFNGDTWEYETDWKKGADLFPSKTDNSKFSNLYTLRENPGSSIYKSKNINEYFKRVFKNPVNVEIDFNCI